jgi:hypothetical protein
MYHFECVEKTMVHCGTGFALIEVNYLMKKLMMQIIDLLIDLIALFFLKKYITKNNFLIYNSSISSKPFQF